MGCEKKADERPLRTQAPSQVEDEIVVKHHLFTLLDIAVLVDDAPAIGDVTSSPI